MFISCMLMNVKKKILLYFHYLEILAAFCSMKEMTSRNLSSHLYLEKTVSNSLPLKIFQISKITSNNSKVDWVHTRIAAYIL